MFHAVVKLVSPATTPPLVASSTTQRNVWAAVVVQAMLTQLSFAVIVWATGAKATTRGPRPPEGLTTSVVWASARDAPLSVHAIWNVVRRKSSPLASPVLPAGCGVQTFAGGVAAMLSDGSSYVQEEAVTVYVTSPRSIVHGDPSPKPAACRRAWTSAPVRSVFC